MQVFKSIGAWLKKWWAAILIGLAVVGGMLGLFIGRKRIGRLLDQRTVDKAVDRIAELRQARDAKVAEVGEQSAEVNRLDQEIKDEQRAIVEAHENAEGLSDAEVEAEFARLGY